MFSHYNSANRTVAILCNHQRSVPKGHNDAMTKLQDTLESHREQKEELEDYLHELETGKKRKPKVKKEKKDPPSSPKKRSTDPDKIKEQLARLEDKIRTQEAKIQTKEEGKTVALGTSKINYMDPRITVAWCKRKQVPIEKIFGRSLLEKFPWAMEVSQDWEF
jgi:DNA topoisomerase-1